jgi:hypothetical protein
MSIQGPLQTVGQGSRLKLAGPAFRLAMAWNESLSVCYIETHLEPSITTLGRY